MRFRMKPSIWILEGGRTGDDAQLAELASRLDGTVRTIRPRYNALHHVPNLLLGARTLSVSRQTARMLAPPWPDLVLAAGKRSVPVARWIKKQSAGRTRHVQIGRPRAPLTAFDLVVSTPQYGLPAADNMMELALPLAVPKPVVPDELARWQETWRSLPRPWIAVAVGAARFPLLMDASTIRDLRRRLSKLAAVTGGAIIVVASPRTRSHVLAMLARDPRVPAIIYPWGADTNPYHAALVLADRLVVTSDSLSMLGEAINSGKPVSIFRLPVSPLFFSWSAKRGLPGWLSRNGLLQPPRNMPAVVDHLVTGGYASLLGEEPTPPAALKPDYEAVAGRIRKLLLDR
jgi:uncharacterized protein